MQADYALDIRECFITHWVYADFDVIRNYNRELQIISYIIKTEHGIREIPFSSYYHIP
jgi:hypothetical protein